MAGNFTQGIKEAIQPIETMTKDVMAILNRLHSTPHDQGMNLGTCPGTVEPTVSLPLSVFAVAGVVSEAYSTMESFPVEHWRNLHQRIPNGEHQKWVERFVVDRGRLNRAH